MGRTANHAIVVAQLMVPKSADSTDYVSQGPHPFIVQIRDLKTHLPLEGIAVGDIGPKYGYAPMDNGYMLFDHFRIPHDAMLSRYSWVDPNVRVPVYTPFTLNTDDSLRLAHTPSRLIQQWCTAV